MGERDGREEMRSGRQNDEAHGKADAVDGEAAEPFLEVVAVGAEDEVFIAEESDGDADRGRDGEGDVGDEGLAVAGQEMAEEDDEAGVEDEREGGVEAADHEEADDL